MRDETSRIIALLIRSDATDLPGEAVGKYTYVSAAKHNGPGPGSPLHFPGWDAEAHGAMAAQQTIRFTEGALKADVATALSAIFTIGIPGVMQWRNALAWLRDFVATNSINKNEITIVISYDRDARENPAVANPLRAFAKALIHNDFVVEIETWGDDAFGVVTGEADAETVKTGEADADAEPKGIDDALLAGIPIRRIAGDAVMPLLEDWARQAEEKNPPPHVRERREAEAILADFAEKLNADISYPFNEDVLKKLSLIKDSMAGKWAIIADALRKKHILKQVNNEIKNVFAGQANKIGFADEARDKTGEADSDPNPVKPDAAPPRGTSLSEMGGAERFAMRFTEVVRYCYPHRSWYAWDDTRWARDLLGAVPAMMKTIVRGLYNEVGTIEQSDKRREMLSFIMSAERQFTQRNMIVLAQSEPGIPILPEAFDSDPWALNCQSGTMDLRSGEMKKHNPKDYITKIIGNGVAYDPAATCPRWIQFLDEIFRGDADLVGFVQKMAGYALTGDTREQCFFILHGCGRNGKSTFVKTMLRLLGDYAMETSTETLLIKRNSGIPNDVAALHGSRLVVAMESDEGRRLSEALIKQLTGGDRIAARFLHAEWFNFDPQFKIILSTNHKPEIRGTDAAIWRRVRLIPFEAVFPEETADKELPHKLENELSGVLNWAIAGCRKWQAEGLGIPDAVRRASDNYKSEMDIIGPFLRECCVIDKMAECTKKELYESYAKYCLETNEKPISAKKFNARIIEDSANNIVSTRNNQTRKWEGIGLKSKDVLDFLNDSSDEVEPF